MSFYVEVIKSHNGTWKYIVYDSKTRLQVDSDGGYLLKNDARDAAKASIKNLTS